MNLSFKDIQLIIPALEYRLNAYREEIKDENLVKIIQRGNLPKILERSSISN